MSKGLSWIITSYSDVESWETKHEEAWRDGEVIYICSQCEQCPESGRLHWQAFIKFKSKVRMSWVKDYLNDPTCHCTYVSVERAEATGYGMKSESRIDGPLENGVRPKAIDRVEKGGQRTKETWDLIKTAIKEDKREDIPTEIIIKYNLESRINKLQQFWTKDERLPLPTWLPNPWGKILPSKRNAKRRHYWIFSRVPNRGKTTMFAEPLNKEFKCYIKCGDYTYWKLRGDEECVILDDYNTAKIKWDVLNTMADGTNEYRIFQGGVIRLDHPLIIILSNQSISDLYPFMNQFLYERFIEIELL